MSDNQFDDGGPVFPHDNVPGIETGMTLRDYYAANALAGSLAYSGENAATVGTELDRDNLANWCYHMADAMIRAGNLNPTELNTKKEDQI